MDTTSTLQLADPVLQNRYSMIRLLKIRVVSHVYQHALQIQKVEIHVPTPHASLHATIHARIHVLLHAYIHVGIHAAVHAIHVLKPAGGHASLLHAPLIVHHNCYNLRCWLAVKSQSLYRNA